MVCPILGDCKETTRGSCTVPKDTSLPGRSTWGWGHSLESPVHQCIRDQERHLLWGVNECGYTATAGEPCICVLCFPETQHAQVEQCC